MKKQIIWIASYPRSGNTFLRTILRNCFGFCSGSIYPNEFQDNEKVKQSVGHIDHNPDGTVNFPASNPPLIKTHEHPRDNNPAIYIVRDGRYAAVSLWQFYKETTSLQNIIAGNHRFGTWADHINAWNPLQRPETLLIRFEDMLKDLPAVLQKLSRFLIAEIISETVPDRNQLAGIEGRVIRKKTDWKPEFSDDDLRTFNQRNRETMKQMGYEA